MEKPQSNYALQVSMRVNKKELFLWRVGHDGQYSGWHGAALFRCRRFALEEKQRYFRFRLRRNNAWHRAALFRYDALWAFKIRRSL